MVILTRVEMENLRKALDGVVRDPVHGDRITFAASEADTLTKPLLLGDYGNEDLSFSTHIKEG